MATPGSTTSNHDGAQYRILSTNCAPFHWSPPDGRGFASGPVVEADDFETCTILEGARMMGRRRFPRLSLTDGLGVPVSKQDAL